MSEYKVSWEIDIDADNPLDAAYQCLQIFEDMDEDSLAKQFYIQSEDTGEIFSVDLSEKDEDAVLPVKYYVPFIVNKK